MTAKIGVTGWNTCNYAFKSLHLTDVSNSYPIPYIIPDYIYILLFIITQEKNISICKVASKHLVSLKYHPLQIASVRIAKTHICNGARSVRRIVHDLLAPL